MVSIVIPAHDEEAVIGRLLAALDVERSGLEVVVVANACSDRTAEIARGFAGVRVVETEIGSKTNALNLGEAEVSSFPRFYVDADVRLDANGVARVCSAIEATGALCAAPVPRVHLDGASWVVRMFYRAWEETPYYRSGMVGCGVYTLSEAGRARFDEFPDVIADDRFVRAQYAASERIAVPNAVVDVEAPRTLADLVRAKTRSRLGVLELDRRYPDLGKRDHGEKSAGGTLRRLLSRPWLWVPLVVYAALKRHTDRRAHRQLADREAGTYRWERDVSTRAPVGSE